MEKSILKLNLYKTQTLILSHIEMSNPSILFLISQILAWVAIVSDIFSFQYKERKKIITFFIISAVCIAIHYLLLGRYVGASIVGLGVVRFFVSYQSTKQYWIYIFSILFIVLFLIFFRDLYDILMLVGIILITVGVFQPDDKKLRLLMMGGTSCIIIYNLMIWSPVWVLLESLFLGSNVVGFWRFYKQKPSIQK